MRVTLVMTSLLLGLALSEGPGAHAIPVAVAQPPEATDEWRLLGSVGGGDEWIWEITPSPRWAEDGLLSAIQLDPACRIGVGAGRTNLNPLCTRDRAAAPRRCATFHARQAGG